MLDQRMVLRYPCQPTDVVEPSSAAMFRRLFICLRSLCEYSPGAKVRLNVGEFRAPPCLPPVDAPVGADGPAPGPPPPLGCERDPPPLNDADEIVESWI